MKKVGLDVIISGISTLVDGSVKVTCVSRELSDTDAATLLGLRRKEAYAVFALEPIQDTDLVDMDPFKVPKGKSPSQSLRHHLYKLWEQGAQKKDFQTFYENQLNTWCESIRERLDDNV